MNTEEVPTSFPALIAAVTAIGGLGAAAFGLVDASKWHPRGISRAGLAGLFRDLQPLVPALQRSLGASRWEDVVRAHWVNGRARADQKAIVRSLVRLGLAPENAKPMAEIGHVDPPRFEEVCRRLVNGEALEEAHVNLLGRFDASVEAHLDAAYDRADERYRSASRGAAGIVAVVLALLAAWALDMSPLLAFLAGLLAVPLAPMAKDLASALTAAAHAVRATRLQP